MAQGGLPGDRFHRRWVLVALYVGLAPIVGLGIYEHQQHRENAAEQARLRGEIRRAMEQGERMRADDARHQRIDELEIARMKGRLSPDDADDLRRLRAGDDGEAPPKSRE